MYGYPYGNSQQMNLNWIVNEIINLHKQLDPDYETPSFSQIYPYSNPNQLNLDWILSELKALKELAPEPEPELDIQAVAEALVALPFDSNTSYQIFDYISKDGEIWRATEAIAAGGEWDETKWFKTKLGTDLAVLDRWINAIDASLNTLEDTVENLSSTDISDDTITGQTTVKGALSALLTALNNLNAGQISYNNSENYSLGTVGSNMQGIYRELNALLQATNNKHYKVVCGAIRNSGDGWQLINDSGHNPINITGVTVTQVGGVSVLQIAHNVGATKILSLLVGCDETFAGLYDIGASVGLDVSNLTIYRKAHTFGGMVQIINNAVDTQYSDFTGGTFYPDGNFTLYYPETLTNAEDVYSVACAAGEGCTVHVKSLGYSNAIVRANALDGTAWDSTSYPNQTRMYITFNIREKIVDPSTIVNAAGNFWILGILEVA